MAEIITLNQDSDSVKHLCSKDKRLARVISEIGPLIYTPYGDGYKFLVHEIIEQMLSIKAAAKIYDRLQTLCNGDITPDTISRLADEDIKNTGTSMPKVTYIKSLTCSVLDGTLNLGMLKDMSDRDVINALTAVRGIGMWTAKMYLIFVLNRQDVLPYEDVAFIQSFKWLYKTDDASGTTLSIGAKSGNPILPLERDICIGPWIWD